MIDRRIQWVLSRAVITYGVAAMLLFVLVDYRKVCLRRLDVLTQWGEYPMLLDRELVVSDEKDLRKAIHYYKILAEGFPQLDQAYGMVGYCYWLSGNRNLAIKYYLEAKKRRPDGFWYEYNLGILYGDLGDKERAQMFFKNIVEFNPRKYAEASLPASLSKLSSQLRQHFYEIALDFAEEIRDVSWRNIIKINFDHQRYEEVIGMAGIAQQDPFLKDKKVIWLYAGVAAYMAGKFDMALSSFAAILEQQPDQVWARNFFILTKGRLDGAQTPNDKDVLKQFLEDPVLFPAAMRKVVLHPWSYVIQPGKEILL